MKRKILILTASVFISLQAYGQVGINTATPNVTLEITAKHTDGSRAEGTINPRMTGDALHTADLNGVYSQLHDGALVFITEPPIGANKMGQVADIDIRGYYYFDFTGNKWIKASVNGGGGEGGTGTVTAFDCNSAINTGSLSAGNTASGVTSEIPYTGGNGGTYVAQSVSSMGVTGLIAFLPNGNLMSGNGSIIYTITGTPSGAGAATFAITIGGKSCIITRNVNPSEGSIGNLACTTATHSGTLTGGVPASGVSSVISYTGGDGGAYAAQSVSSVGVSGLTARLSAGSFGNGNGSLTYTITGAPSGPGTVNFTLNIGGQTCTITRQVGSTLVTGSGSLSGQSCFDVVQVNDGGDCGTLGSRSTMRSDFNQAATHTQNYTFTPTGAVSNVRFLFLNTNGQVINAITGGETGNTASAVTAIINYNTSLNSLASGTTGSNALTANIVVIYNNAADNAGTDQQLTLTVRVQDCQCCGAFISATEFRNFMCHNLGADETADPYTPSAAIHGAKYQWGKREYALSQAQDQLLSGTIPAWDQVTSPYNAWSDDEKTVNDPCPAGYRIPTSNEFLGVVSYNTLNIIGTWTASPTNYSSGAKYGNSLFLPAAGWRVYNTGVIANRGSVAYVWTSTNLRPNTSSLVFRVIENNGSGQFIGGSNEEIRTYALPLRCIAE